jgi:hypothetical protein
MKPAPSAWNRLVSLARRASLDTEAAAPYGFSTRVAARAFSSTPSTASALSFMSWRALLVAAIVTTVTVAANLKPILTAMDDDVAALSDPTPDTGDVSA